MLAAITADSWLQCLLHSYCRSNRGERSRVFRVHYQYPRPLRTMRGMRAHDLRSLEGDRADSVEWAKRLLGSGGFCVLDSETTGLKPPVGFVEVAVVDADAKTLFEGTIRPDCRIEPGATRIHGHTARSLADSPP